VNFLFGRPESVFSTGVTAATGMITQVMTQYTYPSGPAVSAEGSWLLASGFKMGYRIQCERATLDFDLARGANALMIFEPGREPAAMDCSGPDGYANEVSHFVQCAMNRRASGIVTAADALAGLEICEAEEKALRSGLVTRL
jgi:hypothetical protein